MPSTRKTILLTFALLAASSAHLWADDITWTNNNGSGGFTWNTPANWSTNTVPTALDHVILGSNQVGSINLGGGTFSVDNLDFNSGMPLYSLANGTLKVNTITLTSGSPPSIMTNLQPVGTDITIDGLLTNLIVSGSVTTTNLIFSHNLTIGRVSFSNPHNIISGTLSIAGGTVIGQGNGTLGSNVALDLSNGSVSYLSYADASSPASSVSLSGASGISSNSGATVQNFGGLTFNPGAQLSFSTASGGSLNFSSVVFSDAAIFSGTAGSKVTLGTLSGSTNGSLVIKSGGQVVLNAAGSFGGGTTVTAGLLTVASSGALGSGSVAVSGGALEFVTPQSSFPAVNVAPFAALGGDLTGAIYSGTSRNVTLAADAILFATSNAPLRGVNVAGADYWLGISNSGSYVVGDDGVTSIYKGAAFFGHPQAAGFSGSISEAVPGQGIKVYVADRNTSLSGAAFNSTSTVIFSGPGKTQILTALTGTANTFDFVGAGASTQQSTIVQFNALPSNQIANVSNGIAEVDSPIAGTVNINDAGTLVLVNTPTGTFNLNAGSVLLVKAATNRPLSNAGTIYNYAPGVIVELPQSIDLKDGSGTWLSPNADVVLSGAGLLSTGTSNLVLGNNRRLTNAQSNVTVTINNLTAAGGASNIILTASHATTLGISGPISVSGKALQIGDTNSFVTSSNGLRILAPQDGTVSLDGTITADTLKLVAGNLTGGSFNIPDIRILAGNMTVSAGGVNFFYANFSLQVSPDQTLQNAPLLKLVIPVSGAFPSLSDYTGINSTSTGAVATSTKILSGRNSSGSDTAVSMRWLAAAGTASDILSLTDMVNSGAASGQTDRYVLELSYDPTGLSLTQQQQLTLDNLGPTGWENAIEGNFGPNTGTFFLGPWINDPAHNALGSYGVDTTNDVVWASIDHNSQFAVVPEPASLLLALPAIMIFFRRRK